ncbi:MAG: peptidoglycan DD-metalloendopeptidase family protein [Bacteroidales bacterium]|jgi:murein DD-endopeptidase MepM/ murein hydrolase activator NlpD
MTSKLKNRARRFFNREYKFVKKEFKEVKSEYKFFRKIFKKKKHAIWFAFIAIGLILVGWVAGHLNWDLILHREIAKAPIVVQPIVYDGFEMPIDSFDIETMEIRSNQLPSEILLDRGISLSTIDRLAKEFMPIFDLRKMKAGNNMYFYYTPDSLHQLQYMIYEKNASDYVVYNFRDTLQVIPKQKEIKTTVSYIEGIINTSLWNALVDKGIPVEMVAKIASVFQWMIDPTSLNKGDRFEVIYENQTVNNESIGVGKIFAARFLYGKRWFEAYQFQQNGVLSYFNEKGESLRRAFLKMPFLADQLYRVSSTFSGSRMHPVLRIRRPHFGVDYAVPSGTPIVSIGDGKVIEKGYKGGGGNTIKIKHNSNFTTGYMHLRSYAAGISAGSSVRMGQVIGYVGTTGLSTGPHLDFRIWQNGKPVDPQKVESPPVEPVDPKLRHAYDSIVNVYRSEFDRYKKGNLTSPNNF